MASIMTLPWSNFHLHPHWAKIHWIPFVSSGINVRDTVLNVVAFLPCGFLLGSERWGRRPIDSGFWVLGAAALFSASGELYQVFNHSRYPTTTDIVSNAAGAYCGFVLYSLRDRYRGRDRSS